MEILKNLNRITLIFTTILAIIIIKKYMSNPDWLLILNIPLLIQGL